MKQFGQIIALFCSREPQPLASANSGFSPIPLKKTILQVFSTCTGYDLISVLLLAVLLASLTPPPLKRKAGDIHVK